MPASVIEIWNLVNEMSPYLLLGFGFAGLLHAFVPASLYRRYLSEGTFRSVLWAALLGVPLPLCSCGVIPTAMSLRKEGASKGATASFLIATPQTGVDSILATASLLGVPFAILRPVVALVTALAGGQLVNLAEGSRSAESVGKRNDTEERAHLSFGRRLLEALRYGYVDMVQDIGRWLVLGLLLAGIITVFVPEGFFLRFADKPLLGMLAVLLVSVPMYVCATGSIPIAAALMLKGLSPGAALVLLMAGPASNMASILVIRKVLGRKTLCIYLLSIILGAVCSGLIVDCLLPAQWFTAHIVQAKACCHETPALFNTFCSVVLACLLLYALSTRICYKIVNRNKSTNNHSNNIAMNTVNYKIDGMMCNHCRANVEKTLSQLDGVSAVTVDLDSGIASVTGTVSETTVLDTVTSLGYTAVKL